MTFDEWWEKESGWGGEMLAEGNLAKAAWNAAQEYTEPSIPVSELEELPEMFWKQVDRLSVLAIKHCPHVHHGWEEVKNLVKFIDSYIEEAKGE
jgi:hypothetical protein